jgi:tRNA (Thr-GGU) A37 N-methylase
VAEDEGYVVHPIGVVRSALRAPVDVTVNAVDGSTRLHVDAREATDGTPIVDLKIAMRESSEA